MTASITYLRVREVRVAAVNNDVAGLEVGDQQLNEVVDGLAGHDQHHDTARLLQRLHHLLDRVRTNNLPSKRPSFHAV